MAVSCFVFVLHTGGLCYRLTGRVPLRPGSLIWRMPTQELLRASRKISKSEGSRIFILGGAGMVKVNGMELDLAGKTVSEYLATTNYDQKRIAVERNGDIVFKSQYDVTLLEDGDRLEVVSFVGGG